ncbi:MAG TPA: arabinan endo-1,5-alpha-L-arabinosidase [Blastocatellia bacterium]|nr:arabinan endo-1,5-alpha-L-arabinosidase [Blastocatellia bacterium]
MTHRIVITALLFVSIAAAERYSSSQASNPAVLTLEGDISPIHDPAIIKSGDTWYVFATNRFAGKLCPVFCSRDLRTWKFRANVFESVPDWALKEIPGARGIWAPDISYQGGRYRLYYSVSTFGSNHSAIGLATNKTLNPASPDYKWVDEGKVVGSTREDDWNAIDPNLFVDANGDQWLAMGSFWSGIKMRQLDRETGKLSTRNTTMYALASRRPLQPPAIEAPFIVRHDGRYYLFVSVDLCCRGKNSTYRIMVGRADHVTGPYADKDGKAMMQGGGTLLVEGSTAWRGPGGQSLLTGPKSDLLAFHAYSAETGRSALQISTIAWEKGWPRAGLLPDQPKEGKPPVSQHTTDLH